MWPLNFQAVLQHNDSAKQLSWTIQAKSWTIIVQCYFRHSRSGSTQPSLAATDSCQGSAPLLKKRATLALLS
jgi:hypothetical protein